MARRFLILLLVWLTLTAPALAETSRRVALVIGNAGYTHVPPLANPANDATDIAAALKRLDFDVTLALDADDSAMRRLLRDFAGDAREADLSLGRCQTDEDRSLLGQDGRPLCHAKLTPLSESGVAVELEILS